MRVDPMKLPAIASRTYTQLRAELDSAHTPDRAALHISSIDHLAKTVALLADEHDIRIDTIPLRYSWSGDRIIGVGRGFDGDHLYGLVGNLVAVNSDLTLRICRIIRNACVSCASPDALSYLAAETERNAFDDQYGNALEILRSPRTKETA